MDDANLEERDPSQVKVAPLQRGQNVVGIEVKTQFALDDARIFDLNGAGIKVTVVTEN
jgi:hypothetical protein